MATSKKTATKKATTNATQEQKKDLAEFLQKDLGYSTKVDDQGIKVNEQRMVLDATQLRQIADGLDGRKLEIDRSGAKVRLLIR